MPERAKRTALLIRCSAEEADAIRAAARKSERTVSGYVLHCVKTRLKVESQIEADLAAIAARRRAGL